MSDKKILAVDDSISWLDYHKSTIGKIYGPEFVVEVANSARKGYDMIYNNINKPYSLILVDLQMELDFDPKYAGVWLIEQIQKLNQYRNVPIIIISATYNISTIANSLQVNYLRKAEAAQDLEAYKLAIKEALAY